MQKGKKYKKVEKGGGKYKKVEKGGGKYKKITGKMLGKN